jgi:hypothetical protein
MWTPMVPLQCWQATRRCGKCWTQLPPASHKLLVVL